jgi:hypothetical protein
MSASTAMEALTAELLGDVGKLHDDVKALHQLLPTMTKAAGDDLQVIADKVNDSLQLQAGHYLVAAEKLAGVLKGMSEEIDRSAAHAGAAASQAAQLGIHQAAAQAAGEAVRKAVGDEVKAVIDQINHAGRLIRWSFFKVVAVTTGAAVLGGLVTVLGVHYLPVGGGKAQQLSDVDRQAIENGQKIQKVWNSLTDKERAHIQQLAGQQ